MVSPLPRISFPRPVTVEGLPDPELAALVAAHPVLPVTGPGGPAWLVSGDAVVREVLSDPSRFSNMIDPEAINNRSNLAVVDPPDHTRLRRLAAQAFTPRRVQALVPDIERMAATVVDDLERAGPPADLVETVAAPLPTQLICRLLGVPFEDQGLLRRWSHVFTAMTEYTTEQITESVEQMFAYMHQLAATRRAALGDDVLSHLIRARDGSDALTEDEIVANMVLLLVAGNETTTKAISRGVITLLHTGQWKRLVDGEFTVDQTAEEILRHQTPIDTALFRWARTDTELAGQRIKAGELVFVSVHLANLDASVRPDAHAFDPGRAPQPHLAFGYGPHFCLGYALAKAELVAVLARLVDRCPDLALEGSINDLTWTSGSMLNAPVAVPVSW